MVNNMSVNAQESAKRKQRQKNGEEPSLQYHDSAESALKGAGLA